MESLVRLKLTLDPENNPGGNEERSGLTLILRMLSTVSETERSKNARMQKAGSDVFSEQAIYQVYVSGIVQEFLNVVSEVCHFCSYPLDGPTQIRLYHIPDIRCHKLE